MLLGAVGAQAEVKTPDTFVLADYRTVQTIDPSTSYDVAGSMRIENTCTASFRMPCLRMTMRY
jgi:hypothetical protein